MPKIKTYFNWSSGKDAALALYYLQHNSKYKVSKLVTSINSYYNRVSMHGLRQNMLQKQADAIQLPLQLIELPKDTSMAIYDEIVGRSINKLKEEGYTHAAFGDIFLEDLKAYRDRQLGKVGIQGVYPLWKRNTKELMLEFLNLGFKALIICADAKYFDKNIVGQIITKDLIESLPQAVDVCGENGEFHTFCFDGPIFKERVNYSLGEITYKEYPSPVADSKANSGFWYIDILPR